MWRKPPFQSCVIKPRIGLAGAMLALLALFPAQAQADEATIAVASNFRPVMAELETVFESQTGHDLTVSVGSTGKLYTQIIHGAPYDIFLAADEARPKRLEAESQIVPGTRFTYAIGQLTLWRPEGGEISPEALAAPDLRHVAIANPELAPYGAAATEVIAGLGLTGQLEGKLVRGENIGQAFAFVKTGNAELGFVALSQVLSLEDGERGARWDPPQTLYTPIRQDAVLLKRSADNEAAQAFIAFLRGDDAKAIISGYGYDTP
ncbi:molybdate ABC transporter substrate-binding protein [Henriciella aquimarina]|uniref:molybdate ABC transporter substrate-binding protein n=1 Tax=Henriciella aquimarina TaxID=545261 RepID=UPI001F34D086|nr:molybdate ABC transporter substrate-binding protein [Henriciella aquimarina]